MLSVKNLILCVVIIAASLRSTQAASNEVKEKIKAFLFSGFPECGPEFGIERDNLKLAKANGDFSVVPPCFYACMFKKTGLITEKGLFNSELALSKGDFFAATAEDKKGFEEIVHKCVEVNDAVVTDGEKGCDRAMLLTTCLVGQQGFLSIFD